MTEKPITNLWLDDVRPCPFVGNWSVAKNFDEAIDILSKYNVDRCFLDHDLAYEHYGHVAESEYTEKTGYDVVVWMENNNIWPQQPPTVHSHNPVGARRMALTLARHYDCNPQTLLKPYVSWKKI